MRSPDWTTLNAYVDGELDSHAAAAVAEAAGRNATVANDIAALYRLKGIAHDGFPEAPPDLAVPLARPRRRAPMVWVAAACLALAVVVTPWLLAPKPMAPKLPLDDLATARALHSEWLSAKAGNANDASVTLMSALSYFKQLPVIPNLASARLTITRVRLAKRDGGPVLQVGYRGVHDCHLSLFVFASAGMPKTMARVDVGLERAYGWQVNELGYMLFARGMDKAMLDLIAHKVEHETRTRAPFDDATAKLLAQRKRHSKSCVT